MLLAALTLLVLATVPLFGGRLYRLADIELRHPWLLIAGLLVQVLIIEVAAGADIPHGALHVLSYAMVGAFVVVNRSVPGMVAMGLGGGLNGIAIAANGGVMPASPEALATAGLTAGDGFANSAAVEGARVAWLGDVLAVPASLPLANVFSVGDVLLAAGFVWAVHHAAGSRMPFVSRALAPLAQPRTFGRLWTAYGLSTAGDWVYTLAIATVVAEREDAVAALALLMLAQFGPSALVGMLGGPLIDRVSRRGLMVVADGARMLAVGSLLLTGEPTTAHLAAVAVVLGSFGAFFGPSLHAALPGLVGDAALMRANAILGTTFNVAVVLGPAIGGLLVMHVGAQFAFGVNAATFALSAILVALCPLPRPAEPGRARPRRLGAELISGLRYIGGERTVRALVAMGVLLMLGSAVKVPVEPLFVLGTLDAAPAALGLLTATWGVGMVTGSFAAGWFAQRLPETAVLGGAVALAGATVCAAAWTPAYALIAPLWLVGGAANGVGGVVFETLLQRRTAEEVRGRVLATTEAAMDGGYLAGASLAAWVAAVGGTRVALTVSGALFLLAALVLGAVVKPRRERAGVPAASAAS